LSTGEGEGPLAEYLDELVKAFGRERILTNPEDLYVYSFHGEFGARRRGTPVAVVRRITEEEEGRLEELSETWGLAVLRNDNPGGRKGGESKFVLVDSKEALGSDGLRRMLEELREVALEGKRSLRGASSLPSWFVSSLKARDGYKIGKRPDSDSGFCTVAPFFEGVETYSSKGRMLLSRGLLGGELEATDKLVDSLFTCTACGLCYDQVSLKELKVNNAIVRARHEVVERGQGPRESRSLLNNILETGNPIGMNPEDRVLWYEDLAKEYPFEGDGVLYWTGCSTSFRLPNVVEATARVLEEASCRFGLLGEDEGCCGLILYLLGFWDEARENAIKLTGSLEEKGVKELVTGCAGCYYAFTRVYKRLGVETPFEVRHTSQTMESFLGDGGLRPRKLEGRYVWHDPCDLGRHSGVYEEPRRVLKSIPGITIKEPPLSGEHALCCGGGGGLMMYDISLAEKVAHAMLVDEISPMGVDGIVTGCPACILNLRHSAQEAGLEIEVLDLSEILLRSLRA
jgi:heterodisulfide reductase subunit D